LKVYLSKADVVSPFDYLSNISISLGVGSANPLGRVLCPHNSPTVLGVLSAKYLGFP